MPTATHETTTPAAQDHTGKAAPAHPVRKPVPKGQLLIDGKWRDAADGATMPTSDPTTEQVITHVAKATPADADAALTGVFATLGLPAGRYGNLWSAAGGLVEVVPFHAFRHVTLKLLPPDARLCEELEREIRTALNARPAADNPAASWLMTAAVATTSATVGGVALTFAAIYLR